MCWWHLPLSPLLRRTLPRTDHRSPISDTEARIHRSDRQGHPGLTTRVSPDLAVLFPAKRKGNLLAKLRELGVDSDTIPRTYHALFPGPPASPLLGGEVSWRQWARFLRVVRMSGWSGPRTRSRSASSCPVAAVRPGRRRAVAPRYPTPGRDHVIRIDHAIPAVVVEPSSTPNGVPRQ
jgi:hypothetical protein